MDESMWGHHKRGWTNRERYLFMHAREKPIIRRDRRTWQMFIWEWLNCRNLYTRFMLFEKICEQQNSEDNKNLEESLCNLFLKILNGSVICSMTFFLTFSVRKCRGIYSASSKVGQSEEIKYKICLRLWQIQINFILILLELVVFAFSFVSPFDLKFDSSFLLPLLKTR